jgi:hypothetical protein
MRSGEAWRRVGVTYRSEWGMVWKTWRFAVYLGIVFTVSAIGAGIVIHALFRMLALIPEPKAGRVIELAQFKVDYVFFLNLAALAITSVLVWLSRRKSVSAGHRGPLPPRSTLDMPAQVTAGN